MLRVPFLSKNPISSIGAANVSKWMCSSLMMSQKRTQSTYVNTSSVFTNSDVQKIDTQPVLTKGLVATCASTQVQAMRFSSASAKETSPSKSSVSAARVHHADTPTFIWEKFTKGNLGETSVPSVRVMGTYSPRAEKAYPKEALELIQTMGEKWLRGEFVHTQETLDQIDLGNFATQRSRVLSKRPAFEPDAKLSGNIEKSQVVYPEKFTKPDVVTFAPTQKGHFQIHARNVVGELGAVGSCSEDASLHVFDRSITELLNDKASNDGTLQSERPGKDPLRLNENAGPIFKRPPAMHEKSFLMIQFNGQWVNLPAHLVENTLYMFHNGKDAEGKPRDLAIYTAKVISIEHWRAYKKAQDFAVEQLGLQGHVYNLPQIENPSLLPDLVEIYADDSVFLMNQGFLDYIEQHLRRTNPTWEQFDALSSEDKETWRKKAPEDRYHFGKAAFMKHFYDYARQVGTRVGKATEGGMDTRTLSRDPEIAAKQRQSVEEGKQDHAFNLNTNREWSGHPFITPECTRPFTQKRAVVSFFKDLLKSNLITEPELKDELEGFANLNTKDSQDLSNILLQKYRIVTTDAFNENFTKILNWKVYQEHSMDGRVKGLHRLIHDDNQETPVSAKQLSDYSPKEPQTVRNFEQLNETIIRYVAAGLSSLLEGCISLTGLYSPDPTAANFEDKATIHIALINLRLLMMYETDLLDGKGGKDKATIEMGLSKIDTILASVKANLPDGHSDQDIEDAALITKIWVTRNDIRVDLDSLTHPFRAAEGLPPQEREATKNEYRSLLQDVYRGKYTPEALESIGMHGDFATVANRAKEAVLR